MFIHTLKYGMLASKGHAVSIPKRYLAKRQRVQDVLEGLVYGYPHCGLANLDDVDNECDYKKYTGRNHVSGTYMVDIFSIFKMNFIMMLRLLLIDCSPSQ